MYVEQVEPIVDVSPIATLKEYICMYSFFRLKIVPHFMYKSYDHLKVINFKEKKMADLPRGLRTMIKNQGKQKTRESILAQLEERGVQVPSDISTKSAYRKLIAVS